MTPHLFKTLSCTSLSLIGTVQKMNKDMSVIQNNLVDMTKE